MCPIMQTEIEAKFTDIDKDKIREKLRVIGANLTHSERLMMRTNFDYPDGQNAWVRVRDEGDKVTMTYKRIFDRTLHGTKEINLLVDDFARAVEFFKAIGLKSKSVQETKRESWLWNNCEITIDTWPWIPPFVEIEGSSEQEVRAAACALNFDWSRAMHGSVETVYQQHYDVSEEEIDNWPLITFIPVPEWLEKTRKDK